MAPRLGRKLPLTRGGFPKGAYVFVDCAYYRDGRRQDDGAVRLGDVKACCHQGGLVWLGLFEPTPQDLDQVRDASFCGPLDTTTRPNGSSSARSASSSRRPSSLPCAAGTSSVRRAILDHVVDALTRVLVPLPADLPAAVIALQHLAPERASQLPALLLTLTTAPLIGPSGPDL